MKRIAFLNQKGGVGKTAGLVSVAGCLEKYHGKKILVIDCDSQANATDYLLTEYDPEKRKGFATIKDCLIGDASVFSSVIPSMIQVKGAPYQLGISVVPGDNGMDGVRLDDISILRQCLNGIDAEYDFCLFDCPANLTDVTLSVLAAANAVIVPARADMDSLNGYSLLIDTVQNVQREYNPGLKLLGVYFNLYEDKRDALGRYIVELFQDAHGSQIFHTFVRKQVAVPKARFFGMPLCYYAPNAGVSKDFEELTNEILGKMEGMNNGR